MPIQLEVKTEGFDTLARGLRNAPQSSADELRAALTASLLVLEADQRQHVAQDTRRLLGSIHSEIRGEGTSLTGRVGPSTRYAFYVEYGRRRGKPPPVSAIAGWARRHGRNPFIVARTIGRRGTRPQPFVTPSLRRQRRMIDRIFARVGYRVIGRIVGGR